MRRRTLDLIFSGVGVVTALLLIVLGAILSGQASFARGQVSEQLGQQRITFATEERLSEEEKTWKTGSSCLIDYAGQPMTTGAQAECYANYYIGMHMRRSAANAGYGWDDETYATMGGIQRSLRGEIAAAEEAGESARVEELQTQLDTAVSLRDTFWKGETLRGMLLTTYGFSIFGEKADQAATASFAGASVLVLLSIAGVIHAFITPAAHVVGRDEEEEMPRAA